MQELVIHGPRLSPFVEKVLRGVALKQIPHRLEEGRPAGTRAHQLPVARIGKDLCWDSTFILRRLDELQPEPALVSTDPQVAAAQRNLEDWSDESLSWCILAIRWSAPNVDATRAELSQRRGPGGLLDGWRARRVGSRPRVQGMGRLPYGVLLRETAARLDDLVTLLSQRPFFYGTRPSVADLAIYGQLRSACGRATPDLHDMIYARPSLTAMMTRLEERTGGP